MPTDGAVASLRVRVTPRAARNEVLGYVDGVLRVKIAAQPVKGQANKELIDFLSDVLGVRKGLISIVKGETRRDKLLAIGGLTQAEVKARLRRMGAPGG